jgi:hypothetical protein
MQDAQIISLHFIKYADHDDRSLRFGLAAANESWPERQVTLLRMSWNRQMDSWTASEWAWFIALLWHKASDTLPPVCAGRPEEAISSHGVAGCYYRVLPHYKFHPADPTTFAMDLECEFRAIAALPRFADDRRSALHSLGAGEGLDFTDVTQDSNSDAARVFDTCWHWQRAGDLLGAQLEDRSQSPGVTYRIGVINAVLDPDGRTWYETERAYIEHRCSSVMSMSKLPEQERRDIADMIVDLASAEGRAHGIDREHTRKTTLLDYVMLHQKNHKDQPVPRAMKKAYAKYGIAIPEMLEAGVLQKCSHCKTEAPKKELKSCPCLLVQYCSTKCQKMHWKAHHKYVCTRPSATGAAQHRKQKGPLKEFEHSSAKSGAGFGREIADELSAAAMNCMSAETLRLLSEFKDANPQLHQGEEDQNLMSYAGDLLQSSLGHSM